MPGSKKARNHLIRNSNLNSNQSVSLQAAQIPDDRNMADKKMTANQDEYFLIFLSHIFLSA
jgi:hypothetical protein